MSEEITPEPAPTAEEGWQMALAWLRRLDLRMMDIEYALAKGDIAYVQHSFPGDKPRPLENWREVEAARLEQKESDLRREVRRLQEEESQAKERLEAQRQQSIQLSREVELATLEKEHQEKTARALQAKITSLIEEFEIPNDTATGQPTNPISSD